MEKTFSDLIKPHQKRLDWHNQNRIWIDKADVLKLLQQVAEAKIAECEQYIEDNPEIALDFTRGREIKINLPTDRIKTEK